MASGSTLTLGSYNAKTSNVGDLVVSGARFSTSVAAGRRRVQENGEIKINENVRPFTAFILGMGGARNKTVGQPIVQHNERDVIPSTVIFTGSTITSGATTLEFVPSTGAQVRPGAILKHTSSGEILWIVSKTDVDTAVCTTRGFISSGAGGATPGSIVSGDEFQILGEAFGQYSPAPAGVSTEPLLVYSRLQTFRSSIEMSGRDMNSSVYGKDEEARQKEDLTEWNAIKIEKAFLFNQGYNDTDGDGSAATPQVGTITDGMINRISTNVFAVGGVLDEPTLESYMVAINRYNATAKGSLVTFTGEAGAIAIDAFARDSVRYSPDTKILGVDVKGWQCSFGTMPLKLHPLFSTLGSANSSATNGFRGLILTVQAKNLGKLTFKGRGSKMEMNVQTPGQDGVKHTITEDTGLDVFNERSMGVLTGITNT